MYVYMEEGWVSSMFYIGWCGVLVRKVGWSSLPDRDEVNLCDEDCTTGWNRN